MLNCVKIMFLGKNQVYPKLGRATRPILFSSAGDYYVRERIRRVSCVNFDSVR